MAPYLRLSVASSRSLGEWHPDLPSSEIIDITSDEEDEIEETRPLQVHRRVSVALDDSRLSSCPHHPPEPGPQLEWLEPDWMRRMREVQEHKAKERKAQERKAKERVHGWLKNVREAQVAGGSGGK
ncbi:unnamed protein product [Rhizoctonia solani]|uniref:Uncharacterized protein n=2 Tax=Rhizoctonia solani TaxID=456999 RepID=A0A8H3C8R5_9AGAM